MAKIVVSYPGERVVSEITALVKRPASPSVAAAPHIGLVQIGEIQPTELIPGPPGAQGPRGSRWYTGDGEPTLSSGIVTGDAYLDDLTDQVWAYNGTAWVDTGTNIGGTDGIDGSPDTGAEILAKLAPVDGAGSGLDADLLDGQHGAFYQDYANLTGKPATFPPTLPIPSSGVTGLDAAQAAQDTAINLRLTDAPTDGLVYGRKDAAWSTVIGGAHTDDNPPAGPLQDGQLWWQSSTGNTFIWYVDADGGQWVQQNISQLAASGQVGEVVYFARDTAPVGFLVCNGASYTTAAQPILFAAIGYRFGGSGLNFNVPQLLGEFIRGWDNGRGVDAARVFGSAQADAYLNHAHTANALPNHNHGSAGASAYVSGPVFADAVGMTNRDDSSATKYTTSNSAGTPTINISTTGGTETRPRNVALLPCIRYLPTVEGIAPDALPMPVFKGARVKLNADKNVNNATVSPVTWDAEVEDVGDWWSSGSTFIVPAGVTRIKAIGSVCFASHATGSRQGLIYKNGAALSPNVGIIFAVTGTAVTAIVESGWLSVVPGDTISFHVYQNSGGGLSLLAANSWFAIEAYPGQ